MYLCRKRMYVRQSYRSNTDRKFVNIAYGTTSFAVVLLILNQRQVIAQERFSLIDGGTV